MKKFTELSMISNCAPVAIRYWDEILRPIIRPYADAGVLGFHLVHDNAGPYRAWVFYKVPF